MEAKYNPYRDNPNRTKCEEFIYDQGYEAGIREVVEFISDLIIGIDGCKFEERLDGDKGCIVLDMNENQWQAKLKEWKIELP